MSVLLSPKTDGDLLYRALSELTLYPTRSGDMIFFGRNESFNTKTGELRIRDAEKVAEIKRAYSAEIVKSQAKKYGWLLKETAPYQYQVIKR